MTATGAAKVSVSGTLYLGAGAWTPTTGAGTFGTAGGSDTTSLSAAAINVGWLGGYGYLTMNAHTSFVTNSANIGWYGFGNVTMNDSSRGVVNGNVVLGEGPGNQGTITVNNNASFSCATLQAGYVWNWGTGDWSD